MSTVLKKLKQEQCQIKNIFKNGMNMLGLIAVLLVSTSCTQSFPDDPENSFRKALESGLQVGIAENPPFIVVKDNHISGTEIAFIERFARRHNLVVEYQIATESQLIQRLESYKVHIVAGGFEKETMWGSKVSASAPYDYQHVLLVPKGENNLLYRINDYIFEVR